MSVLYFIKDNKCFKKEGNTTGQVGKSDAFHVSQGTYDGKDAYAITYKDGKVYMTIGNGTSEVNFGSKLGTKIVETQFNDNGIILKWDNGKMYFRNRSGGKEFKG